MSLLTREQYPGTISRPEQVADEPPPLDFWPYFDAITAADFEGDDCSAGVIEHAWRMWPGAFEHVLVNSEDRNIFMELVLDREAGVVHGQRLLELNREYGLNI